MLGEVTLSLFICDYVESDFFFTKSDLKKKHIIWVSEIVNLYLIFTIKESDKYLFIYNS